MSRDFYLAAYDIASGKRLRRARERISAYASGGQKSVFECLLTPAESRHLFLDMSALLRHDCDRFLLLRLDPRARLLTLGRAAPPRFSGCMYVG